MTARRCFGFMWVALLLACDGGSTTPADESGLTDGGVERPDSGERPPLDQGVQADADPLGPRINTIIPNRGDVEGGTRIRVVGRDFEEGVVVLIGGRPCDAVEVESENHVRCVTPEAEQSGSVDVEVIYPGGVLPAVVPDGFTYFRTLSITSVDP